MVVFRGTRPRAPWKEVAQELHAAVKMSSGAADTGESKNKSLLRNERVPGARKCRASGLGSGPRARPFQGCRRVSRREDGRDRDEATETMGAGSQVYVRPHSPPTARGEAGAVPERKGRQACPVTAWSPGAGLPAQGLGFPYPSTTCLPRLEPAARAGLCPGARRQAQRGCSDGCRGRWAASGRGSAGWDQPGSALPLPSAALCLRAGAGVGTGLPALVLGDTGSGCPAGTEADLGDGHHRARGPRAEQTRGGKGAWRWA